MQRTRKQSERAGSAVVVICSYSRSTKEYTRFQQHTSQSTDIANRHDFKRQMHDTQCILFPSILCIFLQISFLTATSMKQFLNVYSDKIAND